MTTLTITISSEAIENISLAVVGRLIDDKEAIAKAEYWSDDFTLKQVEKLRKLQRDYNELSEAVHKARKAAREDA